MKLFSNVGWGAKKKFVVQSLLPTTRFHFLKGPLLHQQGLLEGPYR